MGPKGHSVEEFEKISLKIAIVTLLLDYFPNKTSTLLTLHDIFIDRVILILKNLNIIILYI